MSILNVNKINPVGGGSTITIAGIASVTSSVTAPSFVGAVTGNVTGNADTASGLSGNPSINTTGIVTATSFVGSTPLSHRNKVINGAMNISQRGTSFSSASNAYHLDRFFHNGVNDGAVTISQSTTSPDGFANSYKVDVTTADTSIAAAQYIQIFQRIEAQNLQDLAFGTSAAKTITVSFYVRSNLTGTYTFAMQQPDSGYRQMSQTYTIDSANTWERKIFTVVGDTSGGINNDNGDGLNLFWNLAIGSNYTTGSSSSSFITYASTNFAAGHTANLLSSTSNEFYITGVQLEVGPVATPFEHRSRADELRRCQRYCYVIPYGANSLNTKFIDNVYGDTKSTSEIQALVTLPAPMRATPTYTGSSTNVELFAENGSDYFTADGFSDYHTYGGENCNSFSMRKSSAGGITAGQSGKFIWRATGGFMKFEAEL